MVYKKGNKMNKNDGKDFKKGIVAHIFRKFIVPDIPGSIVKGIGFGSIILSTKTISIEIEGRTQRAYEIEALVPTIKIQGKFQDLKFEETIQREFGHPLFGKPDEVESES